MFKQKKIFLLIFTFFSFNSYSAIDTIAIKDKINSKIQSTSNTINNSKIDKMLNGKGDMMSLDTKNIKIAKNVKRIGKIRGAARIINGKGIVSTGAQVIASEVATDIYLNSKLNQKRYDDFKNDPEFLEIVQHISTQFNIIDSEFQTDQKWKRFYDICQDPIKSKEMINYILTLTPVKFDKKMTEIGVISTKNLTNNIINNNYQFNVDSYEINSQLKRKRTIKLDDQIDHIPAYKSIEQTLIKNNFQISNVRSKNPYLDNNASTIITPTKLHKLGRTYSKTHEDDINKLKEGLILDLSSVLYLMRYNNDIHNLYSKKELKQMFIDYQKSGTILYIRNKQLCLI